MRVRVSWKAEEPNSEEVDSSGESPRVRPLFSRQGVVAKLMHSAMPVNEGLSGDS